jgi:hypothetical protein
MMADCHRKQNHLPKKIYRTDETTINKEFLTEKLWESCLVRIGFFSLENGCYLSEIPDRDIAVGKVFTIQPKDILMRLNSEIRGDFVKILVLNKGIVCWIVLDDLALRALKPL